MTIEKGVQIPRGRRAKWLPRLEIMERGDSFWYQLKKKESSEGIGRCIYQCARRKGIKIAYRQEDHGVDVLGVRIWRVN